MYLRSGDGAITLLPTRVPDLGLNGILLCISSQLAAQKRHFRITDLDVLCCKFDADGALGFQVELVRLYDNSAKPLSRKPFRRHSP